MGTGVELELERLLSRVSRVVGPGRAVRVSIRRDVRCLGTNVGSIYSASGRLAVPGTGRRGVAATVTA